MITGRVVVLVVGQAIGIVRVDQITRRGPAPVPLAIFMSISKQTTAARVRRSMRGRYSP